MQTGQISIKTKDGAFITASACGLLEKHPRGAVVVSHGLGEHSGCYQELVRRLSDAGYASVVFDQRGHGRMSEASYGKRKKLYGVIPSYQSFLDDLGLVVGFMKQSIPGAPVVLYGHSMGGNIVINYLLKHGQSDFSCAVLESPWLGLYRKINPFLAFGAKILGHISPNITVRSRLRPVDVTDDGKKSVEIVSDPLSHDRLSLRLFSGARSGGAYAIKNAPRLKLPICLAIAQNDTVVSNRAIRTFFGRCGANVVSEEYDACHSIHNDVNRADFYRDVIAFLNRHCE